MQLYSTQRCMFLHNGKVIKLIRGHNCAKLLFSFGYGCKSPRESTENSTSAEQRSQSYCSFSEDLSHLPLGFPTTGFCLQEKHSFVAYFLILSYLILTVKASSISEYRSAVTDPPWRALSFWNLLWNLSTYWTKNHLRFLPEAGSFRKFQTKQFFFPWSQFSRLYKGCWSKMWVLNLFERGVVTPLDLKKQSWEILLILPFVSFGADTWEKPLSCPSSLFVCGTLCSQQHIYRLQEHDCPFLNLWRLWGRTTTGAGKRTNKPHLQMGGVCFCGERD